MTTEELEIHFGDEFTNSKDDKSKFIILDVGNDDSFLSAKVRVLEGKEALALGGTSFRKDIKEITGNWDLERILKAINAYVVLGEDFINMLREYSTKPPRIIK